MKFNVTLANGMTLIFNRVTKIICDDLNVIFEKKDGGYVIPKASLVKIESA